MHFRPVDRGGGGLGWGGAWGAFNPPATKLKPTALALQISDISNKPFSTHISPLATPRR